MLEEIYTKATELSFRENQVVGERTEGRKYYITLEQLEEILKEFED
jgi:hypothetical protein